MRAFAGWVKKAAGTRQMDDVAAQRARLVEIERALARLQAQHELAMSAFKFDEANSLQRRIEPLDDERQALVAGLPEQPPPPESAAGIVPVLARPRRLRRRR